MNIQRTLLIFSSGILVFNYLLFFSYCIAAVLELIPIKCICISCYISQSLDNLNFSLHKELYTVFNMMYCIKGDHTNI